MVETKYKFITFRVEKPHLDRIDELAKKLKLTRSQTIRLALDESVSRHLEPGFAGEIVAMNKEALESILMSLHKRLWEVDPIYESQRKAEEAEEIYQKIEKLKAEGRNVEAEKLINETYKKKKMLPVHFSWPEAKKELTPEERERMLDERYPDRKKQ